LSSDILARATTHNIFFTSCIGPGKSSALITVRKEVLLTIKRSILSAFNQRFIFRLLFRIFADSKANVSCRTSHSYGTQVLTHHQKA